MALAFGDLVHHYDAGRPRVTDEFVGRVADRCGLDSAAAVLEVGAGTGQLTDALLARFGTVTALEPSVPMAQRLQQRQRKRIESGRLSILTTSFEDFAGSGDFGSVWSADAWHWVDPDIAYVSVARLLRPGGCLIALWNLSAVVEDFGVADRLNTVYGTFSPDLVRDPRRPIHEGLTAAGREQIEASGVMAVADHWTERTRIFCTSDQYVDWQLSFAQVAAMPQHQREELNSAILHTLHESGLDTEVPVVVHRYCVVAVPTRQ